MRSNSKNDPHVIFHDHSFDFDSANAVSSTECTGLIPSAPQADYEVEYYNYIYDFSPESANIYEDENESA